MKRVILYILLAIVICCNYSCNKENSINEVNPLDSENELTIKGNFWLEMGDGTIVSASDIDFYDVSTHTIHVKKRLPYIEKFGFNHGIMSVHVNKIKIYECIFHSVICSHISLGVFASGFSSYDSNSSIISVLFNPNQKESDPRNDKRIIAALKNNHLYHEGLRCEIQSVNYSNGELVLNIELYNPDTFYYHYLDPDKMGIGLFHYFTNGPSFIDNQYQSYHHKETVIYPEPWNLLEEEWLTLIKSGERKKISITYHNFDNMPAGHYKMYFSFPGYYTTKDKIYGNMIGMSNINTEKEVTF